MAKLLGLKGRSINLAVTKVGNDYHRFENLEYDIPLNDYQGQIHIIKACGISEITSDRAGGYGECGKSVQDTG